MDIRKVKKLIELLEDSSLSEIEIVEGEESVRLSRAVTAGPAPVQHALPVGVQEAAWSAPAPALASAAPSATVSEAAAPEEEAVPEGELVRAPMVGTFYSASSPEVAPFVSLGQRVNEGETMCIIEAMKMYNQIESEPSGKVLEIMFKNGNPV